MLRDLVVVVVAGSMASLAASVLAFASESRLRWLRNRSAIALVCVSGSILIFAGFVVVSAHLFANLELHFPRIVVSLPWLKFTVDKEIPIVAVPTGLSVTLVIAVQFVLTVMIIFLKTVRMLSPEFQVPPDAFNCGFELIIAALAVVAFQTLLLTSEGQMFDAAPAHLLYERFLVMTVTALALMCLTVGERIISPARKWTAMLYSNSIGGIVFFWALVVR